MKRIATRCSIVGVVVLAACLATTSMAAEPSGCVTCHLDKEMLVGSLSVTKAKTSSMQSGAG